MQRWVVVGALIVAAVVAAFFVGRGSAEPRGLESPDAASPEPPGEVAALRAENERLRARLLEGSSRDDGASDSGTAGASANEGSGSGDSATDPAAAGSAAASLDLSNVTDPSEFSAMMMEYANAQLARGPDGYMAILESIEELAKNRSLEKIFYDESVALREVYPWIRFLVEREDRVLDMSEWVYETMAEQPAQFENLDGDILEIFTEGVGALLPGAVDVERLGTFRSHVEKVLAMPEEEMPPAIRKNRGDLKRLLERYWTEPVDPEKAFEMLRSGQMDLTSHQAAAVLRTLTPEQLAQLDVASLVTPLVESGSYEAIRLLQRLPDGAVNPASLDVAVLRKLDEGELNAGWLRSYLDATGRLDWSRAQSFFERGLAGTDKARMQVIQLLAYLPHDKRPDKAYVEDLLRRYDFDENYVRWIKSQYGIED